ncbi:MAG: glutamyl-tRNA reductase [Bacillota bacterium]|nr:glutamyl-tRNA reductase [Bacillota bacterium]MDI7249792.1 glutamyl-tRNA reductase [Bacillota bacterium]
MRQVHRLLVWGVSYRSTPVETREALAVPTPELPAYLVQLLRLTGASECALLCTCNRVEVYLVDAARPERLREAWAARAGAQVEELIYRCEDAGAARHLFRVAGGLDAMVTGETQVLGQVRQALQSAREAGTAGKVLNALFCHAVRAARRVHSETAVSGRIASVSALAVEAAVRWLGTLAGRSVLVVGAGKMGRLALSQLRREGAGEVLVCTRDPGRARQVPPDCALLPLEEGVLRDALSRVDLVLSCTAAPGTVIGGDLVAAVLPARNGRPLLVIDLAVPRDVDPSVGELEGVELYDIDALDEYGDGAGREQVERAEAICTEEAGEFAAWLRQQRAVPVIRRVRERAQRIRREELERAMRELPGLGERERRVLETLAHRLVNRVLDGPIAGLKGLARQPGGEGALEVLARSWEGRGRDDKRKQAAL